MLEFINFLPIFLNNSSIPPNSSKAEVLWYIALSCLANSIPSILVTSSYSYRSFLFPTKANTIYIKYCYNNYIYILFLLVSGRVLYSISLTQKFFNSSKDFFLVIS